MDLFDSMRIFRALAETSSFTRAADNLAMPKATVSLAIQNLEAKLGTRLFQRTTRRVQLTQDGQLFLERSKDLIADIEEIETMFVREDDQTLRGRIRVDMAPGFARNAVVPKLPEFLSKFPGIEIELSSTDRKVDLVQEGFDFVVRGGSLVDSSLVVKPLGEMKLYNLVSRGYVKKYGKPKSLDDLKDHVYVHYLPAFGMKSGGFDYFDGKETIEIPMRGAVTVNNTDSYIAACMAGLGMIQNPIQGLREQLKSGELVEVLPQYRSKPLAVSILYPHRRHLPRRVQVFMNWLIDVTRDYLD